jgi:ferredoxin/flavodoxin---NADP+ reductase
MKTVFVVGAGPAGLFAAQKIAQAGHQVMVFNRDIKPGGLAEYGIYLVKDKMKIGLRKQFAKVLSLPNVHYFGHVPVGSTSAVTIEDLRQFNPAAMVFSVGAQGTKSLGLPGEHAKGVYSAKDFVYFYNQLPPFASQDFSTGKRIAVIGMGNVAIDIIRWLLQDDPNRQTEEVIIVARRGPFEAKFDEKEFAHAQMHLDRAAFQQELERVKDKIAAVGQDISKVAEATFPALVKYPNQELVMPRLRFRFLSSPKEIHAGPDGRINRLTVTENLLVAKGDGTAAKATDQTTDLDVDTMIFAIGDVQDPTLGLPYGRDGYVTQPDPADPKAPAFGVFDPEKNQPLAGVYVVGWARRASDGLVGIARHDGEVGAEKVLEYLKTVPEGAPVSAQAVQRRLESKGVTVVTKEDINLLGKVEEREAQQRKLTWFKYSDDTTMLNAIEKEKAAACVPAD